MTTTTDWKTDYEREGYVIVPGLFSADEMGQWKQIMKEDLAPRIPDNPSGVFVWRCDGMPPVLLEAMRDQRMLPILQQLLGPNIEFLSAKAVFKDRTTRFGSPWHQDWFYWRGTKGKLSVWVAVDDATPENGCIQFVPGTHGEVLNMQKVSDRQGFVNRIAEEDLAGREKRTIACKAGDAVFFHDLLVHGSHANSSGEDRWSLIATFRDGAIKDDSTDWVRSLIISGESVNEQASA